jgi:hypothetical protein
VGAKPVIKLGRTLFWRIIDDENQDVSMGVEIVAIWNWERKNYFIKE